MSNFKDFTPAPWLTDTIAADKNNYNPNLTQGLVNALRLTASGAPRNITGMTGGYAGRQVTIFNIGSNAITLKDASGSSSAENRFALSGDVVLQQDQSCKLIYDAVSALWRLESTPQVNAAGIGTVTSVSVTTANGVSGSVATATTTPAITLTLGAITPTSVAATGVVGGDSLKINDSDDSHTLEIATNSNLTADRVLRIIPGDASRDLTLTGNASIEGTNTGDQFTAQAADSLVGRGNGGGAGAAQTITLGAGLAMTGTVLDVTGGGSVSKSPLGGTFPSIAQNVTKYLSLRPVYADAESAVDPSDATQNYLSGSTIAPFAGTLRNLYVACDTAVAAGQTMVFTVMKNGVATALTCTLTDAGVTASDIVNAPAVVAGDYLSMRMVTSATSGTIDGTFSLELRAS